MTGSTARHAEEDGWRVGRPGWLVHLTYRAYHLTTWGSRPLTRWLASTLTPWRACEIRASLRDPASESRTM